MLDSITISYKHMNICCIFDSEHDNNFGNISRLSMFYISNTISIRYCTTFILKTMFYSRPFLTSWVNCLKPRIWLILGSKYSCWKPQTIVRAMAWKQISNLSSYVRSNYPCHKLWHGKWSQFHFCPVRSNYPCHKLWHGKISQLFLLMWEAIIHAISYGTKNDLRFIFVLWKAIIHAIS